MPAWVETKTNIREARYRLSLRTASLDTSLAQNGGTPRNGNSTSTSLSFIPKEEISMQLMSP